ncbi:hypothetical protein GCM10010452_40350 [Crossiella cryophila]
MVRTPLTVHIGGGAADATGAAGAAAIVNIRGAHATRASRGILEPILGLLRQKEVSIIMEV